jgi:hypothetical protein
LPHDPAETAAIDRKCGSGENDLEKPNPLPTVRRGIPWRD